MSAAMSSLRVSNNMKISFNKKLCFSGEGQMKVNVEVGAKHVIHI